MKVEPVELHGKLVRLEPLAGAHASDLYHSSRDPEVWRYKPVAAPGSVAQMAQLIADTLAEQHAGRCQPFAVVERGSGRAVGETRYHNFTPADHGLEIGWTWLAPRVQRTGVNTECKFLLLRHAFERLGAARVQFRTHHLNTTSQRALERLGAVREGVLRRHMLMPDGSWRDSVYFSIIETEWPAVRVHLEQLMQHHEAGTTGGRITGATRTDPGR
ncbi:GNAT family N-acetyltransferase [Micromonospora sp. NPDC003776]